VTESFVIGGYLIFDSSSLKVLTTAFRNDSLTESTLKWCMISAQVLGQKFGLGT